MFPYQKVHELNRLELMVYKYVIGHTKEIQVMTIREMADAADVSTTTILRFLKKMGYNGFSEFKVALSQNLRQPMSLKRDSSIEFIEKFFQSEALGASFNNKLNQAADMINAADLVLFFGAGNSGRIAQYGASVLSSYGIYSLPIIDPFQPEPFSDRDFTKTLLIVISISGESNQVLEQTKYYKSNGAETIALTANSKSTLNRLTDFSISYDTPQSRKGHINITTQVPIVYTLERISHYAYHKMVGRSEK